MYYQTVATSTISPTIVVQHCDSGCVLFHDFDVLRSLIKIPNKQCLICGVDALILVLISTNCSVLGTYDEFFQA